MTKMGNKEWLNNLKISKSLLPIFYLLSLCLFLDNFACSTKSIRQNLDSVIIENIPFYPQKEYQCGPASLASVLNFWGIDITPDEIAKEIFSKKARGTLNIDMLLYAKKRGLFSDQYRGNWEDLKGKIKEGYPLIVLVDYGIKPFFQANHFMVIIGYNEEGVIVNSDKSEHLFIEKDKFLELWKKTDYWTLLIKRTEKKTD
jgi:predicted double-glycine peptidase